jgi:outer membrane protein assembly factor BamB
MCNGLLKVERLVFGFLLTTVLSACVAAQPYPLSLSLQTLERDVSSSEYHEVLATMIPTDLSAEWLRVATPDNYHVFLMEHGGLAALEKDLELKRAFERRQRIATGYLELMRKAYAARKAVPPFDNEAALRGALESVDVAIAMRSVSTTKIEPIFTAAGAEAQWPCLRGPTRQGHVIDTRMPQKWSKTENVIWRTDLSGRGNSSPVIWGDRLWVTAEVPGEPVGRVLLCLDRQHGGELWKLAAPTPNVQETLYWKNTYASSTPVTDGERVIAFFGNAGLLCASVDGEKLWHVDLGPFTTMHGTGTTPVLYRDLVIVIQYQSGAPTLFAAFDKKTGEKRWQHERPGAMCWATPVLFRIGDRDELIYNGSNYVIGYDPASGEELWKLAGTSRESVPMVVSGGGLLYSMSGRNGPILAIRPGGNGDVTQSHLVWSKRRGGPHVPSPAYHNDRIYVVNDMGILTCLDARSGDSLWQRRMRGRFSVAPLVVGEMLFLMNEDGLCSLIKTGDAFELIAENDLGEPTLSTPAVLGGRIYFRTEKAVICVGE